MAAPDVISDLVTTGNEETIDPARKGSMIAVDERTVQRQSVEAFPPGWNENALGPSPTEEEHRMLRKVPGKMPAVAYVLCAIEFAERASYYGVVNIFNNFIQFPLPKGGNGAGAPPAGTQKTAGALGMGLQAASGLNLTIKFLSYALPILGAWIADVKWGRYKTAMVGVAICGIAHVISAAGAVPSVLQAGNGLAPFIVSMILLSIGAGLFKSNISPMLVDQNPHKRPYVKILPSGERVIVDPESTISRVLLWFYMLVNVGAFFALATTYAEKRIGWWLAFLLPAIIYFLLPILLAATYKSTIKVKPTGNDLTRVFSVLKLAIKRNGLHRVGRKGFLNAAKPSSIAAAGGDTSSVPWNDKFVDDVSRTLVACQIFLFFPIFYTNDQGIGAIHTSQAATLTTNGAPNDLLNNFNPLTIIVFVPILNYAIYPLLRHFGLEFGRIKRITLGFTLVAIEGVVGAVLQYKIYNTSPCGYNATSCAQADGTVSPISIWAQIPIYVLGAMGECFANVTAYDVAYSRSSPNMKSLVTSIFLFMNAISAAIGAAVTPALKDPNLTWIYAGPAIVGFVATPVFYWLFRDLDGLDETRMNLYDLPEEKAEGSLEGGSRVGSSEQEWRAPVDRKEIAVEEKR